MALSKKWQLIWPFFLIFILHSLAILLFTRGFLLTRTELSSFSHCSDISEAPCLNRNLNVTTDEPGGCWTKPAIDRLVIIVLDALRFDFLAPSAFFNEKKPWMDKLQVLQKLAMENSTSARIFKAIADPPTTSLQRLKGLTTGGLPTFIDIGNSFGAPAIIEDNLIYQLVKNKKRVFMMGDDTWVQLFPDHFERSFPFPSFNVKDLDTVDNGCVQHLLPSLYEDNWDVLIAHFLGVDHAGHIFGVDSFPMIEKLEEYNIILEKVVDVLKNNSGPGGLHENTLFIVMGDHGQTLNGDHGGGTAEEVETALFALSLKTPPASTAAEPETSCKLNVDGKTTCYSSLQQLDFAVTVAALLGVPFPFGSIGRVNHLLYALGAGSWNLARLVAPNDRNSSSLKEWMLNYVNVLCINSWQVKRYIDRYSASSVIGFPSEDLVHVGNIYTQAQDSWLHLIRKLHVSERGSDDISLNDLQEQINAYSEFLVSIAELARSKWTEFDLVTMGLGLCILLLSLLIHMLAVTVTYKQLKKSCASTCNYSISLRFTSALLVVALRGCSFLSNSYILEEGKVASFLFGTISLLSLWYSISRKEAIIEGVALLLLNFILRFATEVLLSKQELSSFLMDVFPLGMVGLSEGHGFWMFIPFLALIVLASILYIGLACNKSWRFLKYSIIAGTILSCALVVVHWAIESKLLVMPLIHESNGRNLVPRLVYSIGFGLLVLLSVALLFEKKTSNYRESLNMKTLALVSTWSATVIILMGRQGPLMALVSIIGACCIIRMVKSEPIAMDATVEVLTFDPLPIIQWSLLAVCLFFYTGHWCAFDGLRYKAAFVGFDEFNLVPQAVLLMIDTFGISHILPIFGLPYLVLFQYRKSSSSHGRQAFFGKLSQVFLIYGLITAITTTFTVICVMIQRRHLMVWGLFAPKFVFDAVALILTDVCICFSSLYYFSQVENDTHCK